MNYAELIEKIPESEKPELLRLLRALDEARANESARGNFLEFVRQMWPQFICGRHHEIMADAFQRVVDGKLKRLIICMPPRSGKSELTSYMLPAWYLGKHPDHKIIQASHTAELAVSFGRKVRNLVDSEDYQRVFPSVKLQSDSKAAGRWSTNKKGEYFAIGNSGALAGKGANCAYFASKCLTRRGILEIADVKVGDEVWGYDHKIGRACWTRVYAVSTQRKPEIINVGRARCTPDHRIFTTRGYEEAASVCDFAVFPLWKDIQSGQIRVEEVEAASRRGGEGLLFVGMRARPEDESDLQMRGSEVSGSADMQGLPFRGSVYYPSMYELLKGIREAYLRAQEKLGSAWKAGWDFLLPKLLFGIQGQKSNPASAFNWQMQEVRSGRSEEKEVLLHEVLCSTGGTRCNLYREVVLKEGRCKEAGSWNLRDVRQSEGSRCGSSYRSQCEESRDGELDSVVSAVSQPVSSCVLGVSARDLEPLLQGEGHWVVDIQTGTENFFCDGILFHNCLIMDDIMSEQEAIVGAYDRSAYDRLYEWYALGPRQRLQPGGSIILVMTRWSKLDLVGRLLAESIKNPDGDQWELIEFPAILPSGNALWPEFWPLEEVLKVKAALPVSRWNAQYQQDPTSEEGALIKRDWWNIWESEKPPPCEAVIVAMDTAFSKTERSDYSACVCFGVFNHPDATGKPILNLILLDAWKDKMEFPELKATTVQYYKDWQPDMFIIEKKASGAPLIAELRNAGVPVQEFTPTRATGDKIVRVNAITDIFASGVVWAPDDRFAEEVVEECAAFPSGDHDDYVDAVTMALMRFRQGGFMIPTDEEDEYQPQSFRKEPFY